MMISSNARLFLYQHPISMHRSFEGLSSAIEQTFPGELLSGAYFVFLNRQKDYMKVLYWDIDGFVIWSKRLEKGSFASSKALSSSISRREFLMLLEGITPKRLNRRYVIT